MDHIEQTKTQRDTVRQTLIKALKGYSELPSEIRALLAADEEATRQFHAALKMEKV